METLLVRKNSRVAIVMGSDSDLPVMEETLKILEGARVYCEVRILSAHRVPAAVAAFAKGAGSRGLKVLIAGAGGAAPFPRDDGINFRSSRLFEILRLVFHVAFGKIYLKI